MVASGSVRLTARPKLTAIVTFRIGARLLSAAFQAALFIVLARVLGVADFGLFAAAFSGATLVSALLGLGGSARVLNVAGSPDPRRDISALAWLRLAAAVVSAMAGIVLLPFWPHQMWVVATAGAMAVSDLVLDFVQSMWAAVGRQVASALLILMQRAVPLGVAVALVVIDLGKAALLIGLISAVGALLLFGVIVIFTALGRPRALQETFRSSIAY